MTNNNNIKSIIHDLKAVKKYLFMNPDLSGKAKLANLYNGLLRYMWNAKRKGCFKNCVKDPCTAFGVDNGTKDHITVVGSGSNFLNKHHYFFKYVKSSPKIIKQLRKNPHALYTYDEYLTIINHQLLVMGQYIHYTFSITINIMLSKAIRDCKLAKH